MESQEIPAKSDGSERGRLAESRLAALFERAGWHVRRRPNDVGPDLVARREGIEYAIEVKSAPEGRGDRLVPLFAQAVLQAAHAARQSVKPLAVVAAPNISSRAAEQVMAFAQHYAPDAAAGVIDFEGFARFRGPHLEEMNAPGRDLPASMRKSVPDSGQLFSDLNQWMLKVLLAPELPEELLASPRGQYQNASQLARAANVSVMSAFRFVQQLEREGYLHESASSFRLVRREDLFSRWQAFSARSTRGVSMRFLLPGNRQAQLHRMLGSGRACLALFAAADALRLGFVSGVPPYVYVHRIQPASLVAWKNLRPCAPGEPPDLIVRQAPAPQSVFRGVVRPEGMASCDVLQVWVDVASHPSRGREQADLIRKRVLRRLIEGGRGVEDMEAFARLVAALRPWLGQLVVVGGWAHRLHRFHRWATPPDHLPLRTRDTDLAFSANEALTGDVRRALTDAGFTEQRFGDDAPPATHYGLAEDDGFYAEFLTPLFGSEMKRGKRDATVRTGGITAQKLRYLDLLLLKPWSVQVRSERAVPIAPDVELFVANPTSFIVQRLLAHSDRPPHKKAQDLTLHPRHFGAVRWLAA